MKLPNITGLVGIGRAFVTANRPEILFGTSMVTTVAAVVAAARGGYKSGYTVAEEDVKRQVMGQDVLDHKEIAKLTWINYLPAAGLTGGALGATTGLHLVHVKEKKQLAAMALLAVEQVQKEAEEYKQDLLENVGLAKSEDPKELDKASKKSGVAKVVGRSGEIEELFLVRDRRTGRDIFSNRLRIEDAANNVNRQLARNEAVDLNTFYGYAGFESVPDGDDLGWNPGVDVEVKWLKESEIRDDGRPSRPFRLDPEPEENYDPSH
jgi:hypothetical protein